MWLSRINEKGVTAFSPVSTENALISCFPVLLLTLTPLAQFSKKVVSAGKMNPFEIHVLLSRTNVFCASTLGLKKWALQICVDH